MNWKTLIQYSLILYLALIISGIPIGYLMADIDPSGLNVPSWLMVYKYLAIFFISLMCFVFLAKKQKEKPFKHGFVIILIVTGLSSIIDVLIFPDLDYFGWLLDLIIILLALVIGLSIYKKRNLELS